MANNFGQNWGNVGNAIGGGIQTLGALLTPSATPQMIDQQAQATAQAAKPRPKQKAEGQDANVGTPNMPSPSDDPIKFANTQILLSILPMMAQHAQEAYAQTGKVPDATDAFTANHSAVLGALAGQVQQNQQGNQPNPVPPTITPPQGAMTQSGFDPNTGNIQEAGWVNRGIQGLEHGGILGLLGGLVGPSASQRMGATAMAQKVSGKEPIQPAQRSEIALQQAQAGEAQARGKYTGSLGKQVEQQIAGLTPKEQADFQVAMVQNERETKNQYLQRLDDTIKQHQDFQKTLIDSTSIFGRKEKLAANESLIATLQKVRAKKVAENVDMSSSDKESVNKYAGINPSDAIKELERRKNTGGK